MAQPKRSKRLSTSFLLAFWGIVYCLLTERNMKIHLTVSVIIMFMLYLLEPPLSQVIWVIFAIFFVLISETLNTAIERVVDLITQEYHPLAKLAKDISAGMVLLASLFAVLVGLGVFTEPMLALAGLSLPVPIERILLLTSLFFFLAIFLFSLKKSGKDRRKRRDGSR